MDLQHSPKSSDCSDKKSNLPGRKCRQQDASFVRLEIQAGALRRLIAHHSLVIEEVYCVDEKSKDLIRQALLDSLTDSHD